MPVIVPYFHVHQPFRIKAFDLFSIGDAIDYFDSQEFRLNNQAILNKVALKCYLPTNACILDLLHKHPEFHVSYSISGVLLKQLENYNPQVLDSFKALVATGRVELVNETFYHSLSFLYSKNEFYDQIRMHQDLLKKHFGVTPTAFRNTELIYSNDIAHLVAPLGYQVILAEGVDHILDWRSPNFVYHAKDLPELKVLLKNYRLSDDIAFRFSDKNWSGWPLTAEKYANWISAVNGNGHVVNLFMDYETFGEHQWADTGIFDFLARMPQEILKHPDNTFMTVSQAALAYPTVSPIDFPHLTSWADTERDLSAWISNPMQEEALKSLYQMEETIRASHDPDLMEKWRLLTTSDHFYYMCTKWFSDGDVHKYFSPNESPYEAFVHFMNVLHDLRLRVYAKTN